VGVALGGWKGGAKVHGKLGAEATEGSGIVRGEAGVNRQRDAGTWHVAAEDRGGLLRRAIL
jgi:hypothetical protein